MSTFRSSRTFRTAEETGMKPRILQPGKSMTKHGQAIRQARWLGSYHARRMRDKPPCSH